MYCKKCGSDKHWDSEHTGPITMASNPKSVNMDGKGTVVWEGESPRKPVVKRAEGVRTCPTCGTNLDARDKARKRRREYMKRYRKK